MIKTIAKVGFEEEFIELKEYKETLRLQINALEETIQIS